MTGETLQLSPTQSISVVSETPDVLVLETTYGPGGQAPPAHLHPGQDEHFEVLEGAIRAVVGGEERDLPAGATLDVPRGVVHQMWNPHDAGAVVRWETTPAGRTLAWFRALVAAQADPQTDWAALLREHEDVFRLA